MSSPQPAAEPQRGKILHQRQTRNQIVFPFLLAVLLIIAIFASVALMNDPLARSRVSLVADFTGTLMLLCPAVFILFAIYMLLVVMIYGMFRLHNAVGTPLQRLERLTQNMTDRVNKLTSSANQHTMNLSTRFAPLAHFLSIFDDPESDNPNTTQETPDGSTP